MHECLLCKRDIKTSKDTFWNGCIRNIYLFLEMSMPKKVKLREETLHRNIMRKNIRNILNEYGKGTNEFIFDSSKDKEFPMRFSEHDLYYSLNKVDLYIDAIKKEKNGSWILNWMIFMIIQK